MNGFVREQIGGAEIVSIVVVTYNPIWEKLRATLRSVLFQKGIDFEIVVADDGSKENCFEDIRRLFAEFEFTHYQLIDRRSNVGTVCNLYDGVKVAAGEYTKSISPGDYFYREDSLQKMVSFMEMHNLKASFSDCVFYNMTDGELEIHQVQNSPRKPWLFDLGMYEKKRVMDEYLLMGYNIIGASFITETEVMKEYLGRIAGKVRYLEDYMYKLMVVDGIPVIHQPEITVWYEYAVGITVSKDPKKIKRMQDDAEQAFRLIEDALSETDDYERRLRLYFRNVQSPARRKLIKAFLFPIWNLRRWQDKRPVAMTPVEGIDTAFFEAVH